MPWLCEEHTRSAPDPGIDAGDHETEDQRTECRARSPDRAAHAGGIAQVKEVVASTGLGIAWVLRLEASWSPTICSPEHNMRFDVDHAKPEDLAFDSGGIKLVVLKRQADMLRGTTINFGEKNGEPGFIINTPNFEGKLLEKWGPVLAADPLSAPK